MNTVLAQAAIHQTTVVLVHWFVAGIKHGNVNEGNFSVFIKKKNVLTEREKPFHLSTHDSNH